MKIIFKKQIVQFLLIITAIFCVDISIICLKNKHKNTCGLFSIWLSFSFIKDVQLIDQTILEHKNTNKKTMFKVLRQIKPNKITSKYINDDPFLEFCLNNTHMAQGIEQKSEFDILAKIFFEFLVCLEHNKTFIILQDKSTDIDNYFVKYNIQDEYNEALSQIKQNKSEKWEEKVYSKIQTILDCYFQRSCAFIDFLINDFVNILDVENKDVDEKYKKFTTKLLSATISYYEFNISNEIFNDEKNKQYLINVYDNLRKFYITIFPNDTDKAYFVRLLSSILHNLNPDKVFTRYENFTKTYVYNGKVFEISSKKRFFNRDFVTFFCQNLFKIRENTISDYNEILLAILNENEAIDEEVIKLLFK